MHSSAVSEQSGELNTVEQLSPIFQAHEATFAALKTAFENPDQAHVTLEVLRQKLTMILSLNEDGPKNIETSHLYSDIPFLYPAQYAVPPVLQEINTSIQSQLASSDENSHFPYAGLLLYGPAGTGKSEYVRYLGGALPNHIQVYIAESATIRNSASPAKELTRLYTDLEKKAQETGKYIVLFFDEFDIFMTPHSSIKHESTSQNNCTSERSVRTHHTTSEITLDPVGSQLFATIKSLISGDGKISRVFTVATTNIEGIQEAIARDGRFQSVRMDVPFAKMSHKEEPDYKEYMKCIIYMLEIFSATHCRRFSSEKAPKEFQQAIKIANQLDLKLQKIVPKTTQSNAWKINREPLTSEQRNKIRLHILDFLEVPSGKLRDEFLEHSNFYRVFDYLELVRKIAGLSQGSIANMYKGLSSQKEPDMKSIKNALAEFLFHREEKRR